MSVKPRVLMVDDDEDFRRLVRGWLYPDYETWGLEDGEDLVEELEVLEPDVVVLDVQLRGEADGFTLCRRIRERARFRGLPVLFLTGRTQDRDFAKYLDVNGTAYMTKPIERKELLAVIAELLSKE